MMEGKQERKPREHRGYRCPYLGEMMQFVPERFRDLPPSGTPRLPAPCHHHWGKGAFLGDCLASERLQGMSPGRICLLLDSFPR